MYLSKIKHQNNESLCLSVSSSLPLLFLFFLPLLFLSLPLLPPPSLAGLLVLIILELLIRVHPFDVLKGIDGHEHVANVCVNLV